MNFLDFRKYFFANISALWFYVLVRLIINYKTTDYPSPSHNDALALGSVDFAMILLAGLVLVFLVFATILEILLRKYLIEKKFRNFKLNINIKIPKFIIAIYNVIFSIGLISAGVLFIIAIIFIVIAMIMWIVSSISS